MSAEQRGPSTGYHLTIGPGDVRSYDCDFCSHVGSDIDAARAHRNVHVAGPDLLVACKAQHDAIDILLATMIAKDAKFMPTKSRIWSILVQGNAAIAKAEPTKE